MTTRKAKPTPEKPTLTTREEWPPLWTDDFATEPRLRRQLHRYRETILAIQILLAALEED